MHEHLTPDVKAEAAALMVVAGNPAHPDWLTAVHSICDIEKTLTGEGREQLYAFLSEHEPDSIDDCREVYRDDADFI